MEIVAGKIVSFDEQGMYIHIPAGNINIERSILRKYEKVQVGLADGRTISPDQRRKAYALMAEIADYTGHMPEFLKRHMKQEFIAARQQDIARQLFSLSDCDMTTAREFISYLIDFILMHDIPSRVPLIELCEDINRYMYACLMNKKCAVCGKRAELHHFDAIGMGRDRKEVFQINMRVLPLCSEHHSEAHIKGKQYVLDNWHLVPIALTEEIGKKYGLTKKNLQER